MRKFTFFLMVALLVLALCTSCKKGAIKGSADDTIVWLSIGEPDSLDPHYAYDSGSGEVIYNIYDALLEYVPGTVFEFLPRISTNVPSEKDGTIRDNGTTYVFKIREGIKFHNGNDLTPEDVEYTFERAILCDPDSSPIWMFIDPFLSNFRLKPVVEEYMGKEWKEIFDGENAPSLLNQEDAAKLTQFYHDIIDPLIEVNGNEIIMKLAKPYSPFLNIIAQYAQWSVIMDKEWCTEQGIWNGEADGWWKHYNPIKEKSPLYVKTMGSGPYKFVEWDRAQKKVVLERNDEYWRAPANARRVVIQGVDEWSTRKAMLERGEADMVYTQNSYKEQAQQIPNVVIDDGLPLMGLDATQFNWEIADDSKYIGSGKLDGEGIPVNFFEDQDVRLGFCYSFDGDTYIKELMNNAGLIPPTCLIKGLLGYSEDIKGYTYDLEKATEHFKNAFKGKLWNVGFKMIFLYNTGNDRRKNAMELLAHGLKSINPKFQIEVKGVEWPTYLDARKNGQLACFVIGWGADYPDPHNFVYTYYHSSGDYGSYYGKNFEKFASKPRPALDNMSLNDAIMKAFSLSEAADRVAMYDKVQRFIVAQGIGMPTVQRTSISLRSERIKNWSFNPIRGADYQEFYLLTKAPKE